MNQTGYIVRDGIKLSLFQSWFVTCPIVIQTSNVVLQARIRMFYNKLILQKGINTLRYEHTLNQRDV